MTDFNKIVSDHAAGQLRAAKSDPWRPTAFDRGHMAHALLEQLEQEGGLWVAVRVRGTGWEIVRPRSQEAILEACETELCDAPRQAKGGEA